MNEYYDALSNQVVEFSLPKDNKNAGNVLYSQIIGFRNIVVKLAIITNSSLARTDIPAYFGLTHKFINELLEISAIIHYAVDNLPFKMEEKYLKVLIPNAIKAQMEEGIKVIVLQIYKTFLKKSESYIEKMNIDDNIFDYIQKEIFKKNVDYKPLIAPEEVPYELILRTLNLGVKLIESGPFKFTKRPDEKPEILKIFTKCIEIVYTLETLFKVELSTLCLDILTKLRLYSIEKAKELKLI